MNSRKNQIWTFNILLLIVIVCLSIFLFMASMISVQELQRETQLNSCLDFSHPKGDKDN